MNRRNAVRLLAVGCLTSAAAFAASPEGSRSFVAPLSGGEEVPPRETTAAGNAVFKLNEEGTELSFKLIVGKIENPVAAHIHCATAGVNGPVGVNLFSGTPGGGRSDGILADGVITAPNAGNGCGWSTLQDVIQAMRGGDTYVNVHTNDGDAEQNEGPGDFPGGEIRGQVREGGAS